MKEWIADGNVTIIDGFYATQCSQYTNRLTLRQLVAYFIKEYDATTLVNTTFMTKSNDL